MTTDELESLLAAMPRYSPNAEHALIIADALLDLGRQTEAGMVRVTTKPPHDRCIARWRWRAVVKLLCVGCGACNMAGERKQRVEGEINRRRLLCPDCGGRGWRALRSKRVTA